MLAPLDNEVIFRIAFTDIEVFTCFVKDIIGIDVVVDKIETKKKFSPKIGNIDFEYDIFAESLDHRVIIEIQKVEYDYHFDRFLLYHNMAIAELQKSSKQYKIDQEVYTIVLLSSPYRGLDKKGKAIKDEVLISQADPRNLQNEITQIYGHQLIFLNPHHKTEKTPPNYRDWLDLIYESIYNQKEYKLNLMNKGVNKVVNLIEYEKLTPEQVREMKEQEGKKVVLSMYEDQLKKAQDAVVEKEKALEKAEQEKQRAEQEALEKQKALEESEKKMQESITKRYNRGKSTLEEIAEDYGVSVNYVKRTLGL
jgi:hypothetical protein